ncbi:hypothetical protein ACQ4PT_021195 [Festuca glaucescens]
MGSRPQVHLYLDAALLFFSRKPRTETQASSHAPPPPPLPCSSATLLLLIFLCLAPLLADLRRLRRQHWCRQDPRFRGLAASLLRSAGASLSTVLYLKPLQTGFPADSDAGFLFRRVPSFLRPSHAARLIASLDTPIRFPLRGNPTPFARGGGLLLRRGGGGGEEAAGVQDAVRVAGGGVTAPGGGEGGDGGRGRACEVEPGGVPRRQGKFGE